MRMDHDPAPRSIVPRFCFRYWPKTVIRSKCSEWLLRAQLEKHCKTHKYLPCTLHLLFFLANALQQRFHCQTAKVVRSHGAGARDEILRLLVLNRAAHANKSVR